MTFVTFDDLSKPMVAFEDRVLAMKAVQLKDRFGIVLLSIKLPEKHGKKF